MSADNILLVVPTVGGRCFIVNESDSYFQQFPMDNRDILWFDEKERSGWQHTHVVAVMPFDSEEDEEAVFDFIEQYCEDHIVEYGDDLLSGPFPVNKNRLDRWAAELKERER